MVDETPSRTAYKVALNVLTLGEKPEMAGILPPGVVDATAQLLIASGAAGARTVRWARSPRMVRVYEMFDWMMPGQFEAFAHRKAFFERQVRESIADGALQVLVLGAGYDTLGWRLAPEFPRVRFFEIDQPATAALKAKGLEAMGPRSNLRLIAEDLGDRKLLDVLADSDEWDQRLSTVVLAEGLLQYLMPEAVRELFTQCAAAASEVKLIFTFTPTGRDGRPDAGPWTWLVLSILKFTGEPWHWSIRPEELGPFLESVGWENVPELAGTGVGQGIEFFAVATKACS